MNAKYSIKRSVSKVGIQVTLRAPDNKEALMARSFTLETDDAKGVFEMIQRALCGEVIVPWERPQPRLKKDALK